MRAVNKSLDIVRGLQNVCTDILKQQKMLVSPSYFEEELIERYFKPAVSKFFKQTKRTNPTWIVENGGDGIYTHFHNEMFYIRIHVELQNRQNRIMWSVADYVHGVDFMSLSTPLYSLSKNNNASDLTRYSTITVQDGCDNMSRFTNVKLGPITYILSALIRHGFKRIRSFTLPEVWRTFLRHKFNKHIVF
jgi:hypothetical protein